MLKAKIVGAVVGAVVFSVGAIGSAQADTLKVGISMSLSGPAADYGSGMVWTAKQAIEQINKSGGIKAEGKTYTLELTAYDNKYTAAEGAKVAQKLFNEDGVKFVIGSGATAAVSAMQAISERQGVLVFTGAWGKRVKGKDFPMTFSQLNSPDEVLGPFYTYLKQTYPNVKTVALANPNDASGQDTERVARATLEGLGFKVVSSDFFERSATEFAPLATKIAANKPDMIELGATPLPTAGQILKQLDVLGWKGVKIIASGSGVAGVVTTGGAAAEGTYVGLTADYEGAFATATQRELNARSIRELGRPLDQIAIMTWDSTMALKKAIETANSIDPKKVAEALPKIVFESSYGPSAFGYAKEYGLPNQMMLPIIITQIRGGKAFEVKRVNPPELEARLKSR